MSRLARVLYAPLLAASLTVHGAALLLLGFAVAIERGGRGVDLAALPLEVALVWARLAPALTLLATALCWFRMRGARLALGTFGARPRLLTAGCLPAGVIPGLLALFLPQTLSPSAWVRGQGGWFHLGAAIPDLPGGVVQALPPERPWPLLLACVLAAPVGAATWSAPLLACVTVGALLADAATPGGGAGVLVVALVYSQIRSVGS